MAATTLARVLSLHTKPACWTSKNSVKKKPLKKEGDPNADLGHRDGLLFHGLVDGNAVVRPHRTELVDAAHTAVGQHQSAGFQVPVTRVLQPKKKTISFIDDTIFHGRF